jgi:hypothetical protein
MDNLYVTLSSDSSGLYYPANTIANFTNKLATPLELQHNKWGIGLGEISYSNGYKKRVRRNKIRLDSQKIIFPVNDYQYMLDLTNIPDLLEPSKKEKFMRIFSKYLNKYTEEASKQLFNSCYGENSVKIDNYILPHFPARIYNGLEDLAKTIMNHANCHTSRITVSLNNNPDFTTPEPVYVYTDIKPNLVGDSYVKLLTALHFPSSTAYHRFDFPLYRTVEQSFIESITIRLATKNAEYVLFEDSDNPCVVTLHFKNKSRCSTNQYTNYNGSIYTILC